MRISDWSSDVCSSDLQMLELARVGPADVVYDLGSGDGRIPITAARHYGARGVGIDIDPERIAEAEANALAAEVTDQVTFRNEDLLLADFRQATVITLFLSPALNARLKPKLLTELRPGTRVRSEEHTSELKSLMITSYAVFSLKK